VGRKLEGEINGGRALVHAETVNGGIRILLTGGSVPEPSPAAAPAPSKGSDDSDDSD
jgi:hypothetical protein